MAESEPNSHIAALGDGDVERLLREAETLTREVALETGTPVRDADALLSGELTSPPDPLTAVDTTSATIMSLEDLLGEMGPTDSAGQLASSPQVTLPGLPLAAKPLATPVNSSAPVTREPLKSKSVNLPRDRPEPRVEHMPTEEAASAPPVDGESVEAPSEAAVTTKPVRQKKPKSPPVPIGKRIVQLGRSGASSLKILVLIIIRDVPIGVLSFFDIPFRRMPRSMKNAIGIMGGITLMMGAIAWALPGLLKPSPSPPAAAESHDEAPAAHESSHSARH